MHKNRDKPEFSTENVHNYWIMLITFLFFEKKEGNLPDLYFGSPKCP